MNSDWRDDVAGFEIDAGRFERFSQVDEAFNRSWWDDTVHDKKTERLYETYREPLWPWMHDGSNNGSRVSQVEWWPSNRSTTTPGDADT